MLGDYFHISLNGVKYRLAEDAEGTHYRAGLEALRPPNAVVVQGDTPQKFQMRPDVLVWSITDWSGGEGQLKFDPSQPNRHQTLRNVDPFREPGKLLAGSGHEQTNIATGGTFNKNVCLVKGISKLWAVDRADRLLYEWDSANEEWLAGVTNTLGTASTGVREAAVCGDESKIYYEEHNGDIYSYNGTTWDLHNSDISNWNGPLISLGDYIYKWRPAAQDLWEIPKAGTTPVASTQIMDGTHNSRVADHGQGYICAGHNRLYVAQVSTDKTWIHEVVPSSAAGTGFVNPNMAVLEGFYLETMWFHLGYIYMIGRDDADKNLRQLMYLQPGGTFGTLGQIRTDGHQGLDPPNSFFNSGETGRLITTAFSGPGDGTNPDPCLWALDVVGGGYAQFAQFDEYTGTLVPRPNTIVEFAGEYFVPINDDTSETGVYRTLRGQYEATSGNTYAVSGYHDFGLSDEKILMSVQLACEALPAGWTITLNAYIDGSTSSTLIGSYNTTGGTGTSFPVSVAGSTETFRTIKLEIVFSNGSGSVSTTPKVTGVDIRAIVNQNVRVWDLILDCTDEDAQAQDRSWNGSRLIDNIEAAGAVESVVSFIDGYFSRSPQTSETFDVVVDSYDILLSTAGEGVAIVRLRESA